MYRLLLFLVLFACQTEPSLETLLSGDAGKCWHLKKIVRLKENIEEKKDFQVLSESSGYFDFSVASIC